MRSSRVLAVAVPLVAALAVGALAACTPPPPPPTACTTTGATTQSNVRYATDPGVAANLQSLDLSTPNRPAGCAATPVVVYVHGGGFVNGDKANAITNKRNLFTGAGWAFASVNYRLVGDLGSGPAGAQYPIAEQDVAAAINYVHAHAAANRIDPNRILLLGHSSGAFLVSLVSTDTSFLTGAGTPITDVRCTTSLDTTYDVPTQVAGGGQNAALYLNAFGSDPAVWAQGSPTHHVTAGSGIPAFHIVTRGTADRIAQAQALGNQLIAAGVRADVQVATGLDHEGVNDAVGAPGETRITDPLMTFYRSCL